MNEDPQPLTQEPVSIDQRLLRVQRWCLTWNILYLLKPQRIFILGPMPPVHCPRRCSPSRPSYSECWQCSWRKGRGKGRSHWSAFSLLNAEALYMFCSGCLTLIPGTSQLTSSYSWRQRCGAGASRNRSVWLEPEPSKKGRLKLKLWPVFNFTAKK